MSRPHKLLLAWSAVFIIAAAILTRVDAGEKATLIIGTLEVLLAIATGIAFGFASSKINSDSDA